MYLWTSINIRVINPAAPDICTSHYLLRGGFSPKPSTLLRISHPHSGSGWDCFLDPLLQNEWKGRGVWQAGHMSIWNTPFLFKGEAGLSAITIEMEQGGKKSAFWCQEVRELKSPQVRPPEFPNSQHCVLNNHNFFKKRGIFGLRVHERGVNVSLSPFILQTSEERAPKGIN